MKTGRALVSVLLPWVALRKARRSLRDACLAIKTLSPREEGFADELAHDGWIIWKPYPRPSKPSLASEKTLTILLK